MPAGRPTKYDPSICDTVVEMGKYGASKAEMALELDIDYSTFLAWQQKHKEFSEAVKKATDNSQGWWEKLGRQAAKGDVEGFNGTAYVFNMKNRFKWADRAEVDNKSSDGSMTPQTNVTIDAKAVSDLASKLTD